MATIIPNIIMLGPQGSGKSTQSDLLKKRFGYVLFSAGSVIRKKAKKNDLIGKKISQKINSGQLIDIDILFNKIFQPFLLKIKNKPIIFDGIPRDKTQLKKFNQLLKNLKISNPYLIHLHINKKTAFDRISKRLICPVCDKIFMPYDKGYSIKKCPNDNNTLITRKDDLDKNTLEKRYKIYKTETKKIIPFYKKNNLYIKIDGTKTIKQVNVFINKAIKNIK